MTIAGVLQDVLTPARSASTRRVLTHLLEAAGEETSLADLARDVGISTPSATREADRLLAAELIRERRTARERYIAIDVRGPYFQQIADILYIAVGAKPRDRSPWREHTRAGNAFAVHDLDVGRLVPVELCSRDWHPGPLPGDTFDGPNVTHARSWSLQLAPLARDGRYLESRLQQTYARWRSERDRDLIHLTLHLGNGAGQAVRALSQAARQAAGQQRTQIGRLAWAHAIYAVHAEATMARRISAHLINTVDLGAKLHRRQALLAEHHEYRKERSASRFPLSPSEEQEQLQTHQAAVTSAREALDGWYRYGGISSADSVGAAGERVLAVETANLAQHATELLVRMLEHPSFAAWAESCPDVVAAHPIDVTSVAES